MTIAGRTIAALVIRAERANPMLVRRVRQELRNRAFIGAYLLSLVVAGISAIIASKMSDGASAGQGLFVAIAIAWTALMCLQAMATHRAITGDRAAASWDLIELTGMPPMRMVIGVVQSNLILGLLGAAGLAPFLVMAYLLRGIDLPTIVFAIIALPMLGAVLGSLAACAACVGNNKNASKGMGLLVAVGLIGVFAGMWGIWATTQHGVSPWLAEVLRGRTEALLILGIVLNSWAALIAASLVFGGALLTHRALNRSSGPRLVWILIWINWLAWFIGIMWLESRKYPIWDEEVWTGLGTASVLWAIAFGLFAVTEDIDVTPRQLQACTGGGRWRRLAMQFLGPGSARGARATLAMLLVSLAMCVAWMPNNLALLIACYGCIVLMLGDIVSRGPLRTWCQTPPTRRVAVVTTAIVLGVLPSLISMFMTGDSKHFVLALSPFAGPFQFFSYNHSQTIAESVGGWAVLGLGGIAMLALIRRALHREAGIARITASPDDANPRT